MHRHHARLAGLAAALALTATCADLSFTDSDRVQGSGTIVTEARDVAGFHDITILTSGAVTVDVDGTESLTVTTDDNIQPLVTTEVDDGTLTIGSRDGASYRPTGEVVVALTAADFDGVTIRGSGRVEATGIDTEEFSVTVAGSGTIDLAGTADTLDVGIPGSGTVRADGLTVASAEVSLSGSGSVVVDATDELDITIAGSGSVSYLGDPQVSESITGSGSVSPA